MDRIVDRRYVLQKKNGKKYLQNFMHFLVDS